MRPPGQPCTAEEKITVLRQRPGAAAHPTAASDSVANKCPINIWYDREGDFLEVLFERKPGYFRQTSSDQLMEKVDEARHVIGFHVLRASRISRPLEVQLEGVTVTR